VLAALPLAWVACNTQPQQFAALEKKVTVLEKELDAVQDQLAETEAQLGEVRTRLAEARRQFARSRIPEPRTPASAPATPPAVARTDGGKDKPKEAAPRPKPAPTTSKAKTPTPDKAGKPVITVAEATHDFGTTWVGPALEHSFVIKNTGTTTLQIEKVKPACGCTVAKDYPRKLAPGASGKFPFTLKSSALRGKYKKTISVTSNDPATPLLKLALQGEVKWEVEVKPTAASFGTIADPTQSHEKLVTLSNNTERPLTLKLRPPLPKDPFKYELSEVEPGKKFELRVILEPQKQGGSKRATAVLETNFEKQKEVKVIALARIPERLDVSPPYLSVVVPSNVKPGDTRRRPARQLRFKNNGETPVKLLEATVDDPKITTNIKENEEGKSYVVFVEIPADYEPPKAGKTITLKTDDAQKPEIKIPIRRYDRPKRTARETKPRGPRPAETLKGKVAPTFTASTKGGKAVTNASLKDTVTVLNFFAPNCGFCKRQLPVVEKVRAQYVKNKNVRFVNISQTMRKKYTDEQIAATLKQLGAQSELVTNPDNSLGKLFKATSFPTMFVVGKDGKVADVVIGAKRGLDQTLKTRIDRILNGKPATDEQAAGAKDKPAAAKPPTGPAPRTVVRKKAPRLPTPTTVTPP